jgi:hypothetical protein
MTTDPIQLERRGAQRFDFHLAVTVRRAGTDVEGHGFTQDLSGRGALFYTDFDLVPNDAVELTLVMPSEITLTQSMRVRCRGKVTRVIPPVAGNRRGVAVQLEGYEFLPDAEPGNDSAKAAERISALHEHKHDYPDDSTTTVPAFRLS